MSLIIDMQAIRKSFFHGLVETNALSEFDLKVQTGEFICVTGPSGSGKSTFLNIAGLLDDYDSGCYQFNGLDVGNLGDREKSKIRNQELGFIFQNFNLINELNVYDNVDVPLRYRGMTASERDSLINRALIKVGLSAKKRFYPHQLSGGQQQRIAIARAIAGKPNVILADEPTGNLDSLSARQVMELLEEVNDKGVSIIMVTHDNELARRAHRVVQLVDGQLWHDRTSSIERLLDPIKL